MYINLELTLDTYKPRLIFNIFRNPFAILVRLMIFTLDLVIDIKEERCQ